MALVTTPAVVLRVTPYGETSKIVRLLTRELGLQSAIAKGARRGKAGTGPRLDLFAEGVATLHTRGTRELNPISAFELISSHSGLAREVRLYAAASALVELALRCASEGPHSDIYDALTAGLGALEAAQPQDADATALAACWGLVVALGFAPAVDRCVACGAPVAGAATFSAGLGGVLCGAHARTGTGDRLSKLRDHDRAALSSLVAGRLPEPPLDRPHAAAHRRLLLSFVRHHVAEDRPLPALAFWDRESWTATSS
jgi:DNA repair protein RecO (recombination protein O)